jgi:hypothetical protein
MRKIFSLLLILLLVTTILSSVYDVAINDSIYAQLYSQPLEEQPIEEQPLATFNNQPLATFNNQPLATFNNQPLATFNNQPPQVELSPQQTPIKKILWTSASWSNGNERILKSDQSDPFDSQFELGKAGDPVWNIDGNGNAIIEVEHGKSSRGYILTKNKDVQLTVFVIPNKSIKNISLNVRTNHHIDCGFGGYDSEFSIEDQNVSFKKEVVHGWYSPRLGTVSLKDAGLNEWKYDKKVGLRLEAKNIVADDGKEAVRITSYFNEAGDGIVWKKVTEWTDKQDGGISSGLAEKDFDTNFKKYQVCKDKGDNMVESKEKALAPFLGTAGALWIRVNAADSDGNTADDVLLSNITVEDIGEEQQIQTQLPQMPQQLLNNQPLETVNSQIPEKNFEHLVETPKHNYGQKINDFLEELQASLSYQAAS